MGGSNLIYFVHTVNCIGNKHEDILLTQLTIMKE